jgi:hypothetical protein
MADPQLKEIRHAFLTEMFGPPDLVVHTQAPDMPPLDVAIWSPQKLNRPYVTIATDGLSEHLMNTEGAQSSWACERAELIMYVRELHLDPKQIPWQLAFLRMVADLPLRAKVALHAFFVLANGDPAGPFVPDSKLTHAVLLPPAYEPVGFRDGFDAPDGTSVEYLWVDFLTTPEAFVLRDKGNAGLLQLLATAGHAPPTDFARGCFTEPVPAAPAPATPSESP